MRKDGGRRGRRQQVRSLTIRRNELSAQEDRWVFKMPFGRKKIQDNSMGKTKHAEQAGINKEVSSCSRNMTECKEGKEPTYWIRRKENMIDIKTGILNWDLHWPWRKKI